MVGSQSVVVTDSPGLFDTRFSIEKTSEDLSQCISYSSPGPHVFLVVIRLGRYTTEEMQTVQRIQEIFGEEADKYSMVLLVATNSRHPLMTFWKKVLNFKASYPDVTAGIMSSTIG